METLSESGWQVRIGKLSESEPADDASLVLQGTVETAADQVLRDKPGRHLPTGPVAVGVKAARAQFRVRPAKAGVFSRRQTCRGKSQNPVARIAERSESDDLKPIDKPSAREGASHRAVTQVNADEASKWETRRLSLP